MNHKDGNKNPNQHYISVFKFDLKVNFLAFDRKIGLF